MKRYVHVVCRTWVGIIFGWALGASAAPLPNGTLLTIEPGVSSYPNGPCFQGSCFTWIVAQIHGPTMLEPGIDGGIVIGKNQASGGQESGSIQYNTTSSELTKAWIFFGNYGTFSTAPLTDSTGRFVVTDASQNLFDDTSCSGVAACAGKTELGTLTIAWNGHAVPLGSACNGAICPTDPRVGVREWRVNADGTYYLHYVGIAPIGDPSQFGGTELSLVLRGRIVRPINSTPTVGDVPATGESGLPLAWQPEAADLNGDVLNCRLDTLPQSGTATVASDCSSGTYQSHPGFIGTDSFTYIANDGQSDSKPGTVTVVVTEGPVDQVCIQSHPFSQFSQTGKEGTMTISFTGNIVSHTNKEVKVCPGTTLSYQSTSTQGPVLCKVKNSTTRGSGTLRIKDHLRCTDKPEGQDKVHFKVKSGVK